MALISQNSLKYSFNALLITQCQQIISQKIKHLLFMTAISMLILSVVADRDVGGFTFHFQLCLEQL